MDRAEEIELVTSVALQLCKKELESTKQFVSCGAALGPNRNMELIRPKSTQATEIEKYVEFWTGHLQKFAAKQASRVLVWWLNAKLVHDDCTINVVSMHLEHIDGATLELRIPYAEGPDGEISFGEPIEEAGPKRYLYIQGPIR